MTYRRRRRCGTTCHGEQVKQQQEEIKEKKF